MAKFGWKIPLLSKKQIYSKINNHPLFKGLSYKEFEDLLSSCQLKNYFRAETVLHSKTSREGFLLLIDGMVEVYVHKTSSSNEEEVLEVLQAGELIGLSSLSDFLGEPSQHDVHHNVSVRAIEDSCCLHIPFTVLEARWHSEDVRDYLLRRIAVRLKDVYSSLADQVQLASQWGESEAFIRRVHDLMSSPMISVEHTVPIQEIAKQMSTYSISSVGVLEDQKLVGIITESDLIRRVLTSNQSLEQQASTYMTPTPYTISRHAYYYEALSLFLMNRIKHLPVTDEDQVVGMITLSDLLRKKNRGMFEVLQTIEQAQNENLSEVKEAIYYVLSTLLHNGVPITHTLEVITKLYDRLAKHCIGLAIHAMQEKGKGEPPVPFSWFQMGSAGRKEQFLLTDQDHFLVYKDIDQYSQDKQIEVRSYFADFTAEVVSHLEQAGFAMCKGKMMASEKEWRGSLSDWEGRLRTWALHSTNENILLAHNFFSFRYFYGDYGLYQAFLTRVKEQLQTSTIFFYRMASLQKEQLVPLLDRPILSLFGLDKKEIDIKKETLFPFYHSLQILALHHGIFEGTAPQRIDQLTQQQAITSSFADDLRSAYSMLMRVRVKHAWSLYQRHEKSTSVLPFLQLTSDDKEELIRSIRTIRALQNHTLATFGM
jgi:CBS domain-containing protein